MHHIYKITNIITGDLYIGSAISLIKRKYSHLFELRHNKHHSPILQNSYNKHGENNFIFEMLEEVLEKENLVIREQWWIDYLNPRYNISRIAGSPLGVKHTEQAKLNMSKAHLGIKPTKEALVKRSLKQGGENHWTYGKERTQDTKDKISNVLKERYELGYEHPFKGHNHKEDTKDKISKKLMIPIEQYSLDGVLIKEWLGATEAAKELGFHASNITSCCKGNTKTSNNFFWKYKII